MKAVIFQASVAPFVQQAARALDEAGWLEKFVTTLAFDPGNRWQRAACAVSPWFGLNLEQQLRRRTVSEIPITKVGMRPWAELLRLASGKVDRSGRLTDAIWERTELAFDEGVASSLEGDTGLVYGFEFGCLATFRRARALGATCVYDVPAPETLFVQEVLKSEIARYPELESDYTRHASKREERRTKRRHAEWNAADVQIVASTFTKRSFVEAGLGVSRTRVVPYGAPTPHPLAGQPAEHQPQGKLKLLWCGTFGVRKGAHVVLQAWREGVLGRDAILDVFGSVLLPRKLTDKLPEGIMLHGPVPREELTQRYLQADALLFPTLCDGFGMVATEAWACGLPVITTDRAGAADLLVHLRNGLLVDAGSAEAIISAVRWCCDHRQDLVAMRNAAVETAMRWQWPDYRRALIAALQPRASEA